MATIYNSELTKQLLDGAKIQVNRDKFPNELAEKVIPTMEVNPKLLRYVNIAGLFSRTTSANAVAFYTVPAGKKLILTHLHFQNMSNVTADNTDMYITATIDGVAKVLIEKVKITLTATDFIVSTPISPAIELNPGSELKISNIFTAGASVSSYGFLGYLVDNINA